MGRKVKLAEHCISNPCGQVLIHLDVIILYESFSAPSILSTLSFTRNINDVFVIQP